MARKIFLKRPSDSGKRASVDDGCLELLFVIVNRNKADFYMDILQPFEVNMELAIPSRGSTQKAISDMMGLEDASKTVLFTVIREDRRDEAMNTLEDKFNSIKNGKGIAFTVPFSSVIGVSVFGFLSNSQMISREEQSNE